MFRSVKDIIKLKKLEETPPVKEKWCEEQQQDIECILEMVDDLIACAIASTNSPHGYAQLQEAKTAFVNSLMNSAAKYRHI